MQKILIFVLGLLLISSVAGKTVRLYCQSVPSNQCNSTFLYRIVGDGLDEVACVDVGKRCDPVFDNNITVFSGCTVDYKNQVCTTNACFYAPTKNVCSADYNSVCPASGSTDLYNYGCANCNSSGNCIKCQT